MFYEWFRLLWKCIIYYLKENDILGEYKTLTKIGETYFKWRHFDEAIEYFSQYKNIYIEDMIFVKNFQWIIIMMILN